MFTTAGDSFAAAFGRASDAVRAATESQRALIDATWPGPALKVRMGLHLGEAEERAGDYFGPGRKPSYREMPPEPASVATVSITGQFRRHFGVAGSALPLRRRAEQVLVVEHAARREVGRLGRQ